MSTPARTALLALSTLMLVLASPPSQATNYSVVDLGSFTPLGLSNHGQVVGDYRLWSGGVLVDLRPFMDPSEPSGGEAFDINDVGEILTRASYGIDGPCSGSNTLGLVKDGQLICGPVDAISVGRLNASGQGLYIKIPGYAYVWGENQFTLLPPVENIGTSLYFTSARDINDAGDIVGTVTCLFPPCSPPFVNTSQEVLWQGNVVTTVLGAGIGYAVAIGNGGQIALDNGGSAWLWDAGALTSVGPFAPKDINASVQIVGSQQVAGSPHAVLWESNLQSDLNDLIPAGSGWVLNNAVRISDSGYIIGTGTFSGQAHGFMLVPDTITPAQADLTVTATVSPPGGVVPGAVTVTFAVTNNGPATATGVNLIHNYRPIQYSSGPITTLSQGSCRTNAWSDQNTNNPTAYAWCALGSLPPGGTATVQLTTFSTISNTTVNVSAHAIEPDANPGDNQASQVVPQFATTARADLSVSVSDAPDPAQIGQPVTYTATVTNNGPDIAALVSLGNSAPAGTTNVSATPSVGTCTVSSSYVNCSIGDLAVGGSAFVQVVATPTGAGTVSRSFAFGSPVPDPNSSNNVAVAVTAVPGVADLAITMTGPSQGIFNSFVTYSIDVTNNGPDPVGNVAATGTLTACNFGTLAAGATVSCSRNGLLNQAGTVTRTMTVTPTAGVTDPNPGNNSATVSTTVLPNQADLVLSMTDSPDPVVVGNTVTYTITLTNNGPAPANNATVSGSLATCSFGSVPANQSSTCVRTALASAVGTLTQNLAVTASNPTDPNTGNNSASASTTVLGIADLGLAITDSPDPVPLGGTVTYTITATNSGPNPATNVSVTGSLPACNLGTIAAGGSASCVRTVTASAAGALTQSMSVSATENDPNPANNGAIASTTVVATADLALAIADAPDPVLTGNLVTYTITATNAGPSAASNVSVTGSLPACNLGTIAAGASAQCVRTVTAGGAGTLTQTMSVSATESDPNTANNGASASTTVQDGADLAVTMTDSPDPVKKDRRLTYTIIVSNAGPLGATGVGLSVVLPANITFENRTTSQGSCTGKATVTCALGSLGSGSSATVTIKFKPKSIGTATSTASVTGSPADPNGANNVATASTTVIK